MKSDNTAGRFLGVGVGPGPEGLLPVAALRALNDADVILVPRGKDSGDSVARQCLRGLNLPEERIMEVVYNMESDKAALKSHYCAIADDISARIQKGQTVAYLTLGDSLTYSTYSYTLQSLLKILPDVEHRTFPGITSYAAIASAVDWPLGQGKERTLILPCPETKEALRADIESHDIVVLMKIGKRIAMVLELLHQMNIAQFCAFASKIGLPGEFVCQDVSTLEPNSSHGYFSTMLIRKDAPAFQQVEVIT